jgi:chemotaxis protein CheX
VQNDITRQLDRAVTEIFAVMLHLPCFAEPASLDAPPPPPPSLSASIQFSGSLVGTCTLQLALPTATALTANLTGIPAAEIPSALAADTAGELCNMIAGSWKSTVYQIVDACMISCPIVLQDPPAQSSPFHQALARRYRFDGHQLSLTLAWN